MPIKTSVTTPLDLSNCEREPIHIPGAIQPHGILFVLDDVDLRIVQVSANTPEFFGVEPRDLLGRSIEEIIGSANLELIQAAAERERIDDANPLALPIGTIRGEMSFDGIVHCSGGDIVLELEPADAGLSATFHTFYHGVRGSITRFDAAQTMQQLCDAGVAEVASLTGFDRVMAYRFDDDWHGEVVAEHCADGMEPFIGLHYPASDIPRQARDLFRRSWLRYIPNVTYRPAAIEPNSSKSSGEPLDLSRSVLRSVSPIHLEYLTNMGVAATLTVSLLNNGKLWGLIACHHRTRKLVPYQVRVACELIGRTMSLHLRSIQANEDNEHRLTRKTVQVSLLGALSRNPDIARTLAGAQLDLLALVDATGAAIRYGDECLLIGRTPARDDALAIIDWLHTNGSDELFVTDSLPLIEPAFGRLAQTACGIIALPLSRAKGNHVVWFRPELVVTVNWGGDPNKPVEPAHIGTRMAPRKSFKRWREIVSLHALDWKAYEIDAARELRNSIGSIIVERAEELERVNRELARSNIELDSFAHVASHDLKEPLRGIHNYASYLLEDYGSVLDADGRDKLETLVRLSQRMDALIESQLRLSRVGHADSHAWPTDLRRLLDDVSELYTPQLAGKHGAISVASPLPVVLADEIGLREVFNNLVSNALKYNDRPPLIEIGVDSVELPPKALAAGAARWSPRELVTLFVRDNGIGIREKHLESIFHMFKRLHAPDRYGGGTGAGLAIARKIIEQHGGSIWAKSTYGSGTTFYFTLPKSR